MDKTSAPKPSLHDLLSQTLPAKKTNVTRLVREHLGEIEDLVQRGYSGEQIRDALTKMSGAPISRGAYASALKLARQRKSSDEP